MGTDQTPFREAVIQESFEGQSGRGRLHFDGLYCWEEHWLKYYLRFFPDGTLVSEATSRFPEDMAERLPYGDERMVRGRWQYDGGQIRFNTTSLPGSVSYQGQVLEGGHLLLDVHSFINGKRFRRQYRFWSFDMCREWAMRYVVRPPAPEPI